MPDFERDPRFLAPNRLSVTPVPIKRVLLIGRCFLEPFLAEIAKVSPDTECEFILFNNLVELPEAPPQPIADYAFQMIALPLRLIAPETLYLDLPYADLARAEALFAASCDRLDAVLAAAAAWNVAHGLESFVMNLMAPQTNPDGRLLPRFDLRNMAHFVTRLNEHLEGTVRRYRSMHVVDVDGVAASFGRRHVQDDTLWINAHNSLLYDHDAMLDHGRLERPARKPSEIFGLRTANFVREVWFEVVAMHRTLRRVDEVKMVIVDLDDTLWRGVLAERETIDLVEAEGWPLGVVEALIYLKRRGVLLAIASKNEEAQVQRAFDALFRFRIRLEDFAIRRIGWTPKAEMVGDILSDANLLARNVVFIDDNPVERAAVAEAFPDLRIIGDDHYAIRRILMWSSETQVASITEESARRTEMVQAHVVRETNRRQTSREDFLRSLDVKLHLFDVAESHPRFARALELLNKTNQFNTTGRRWCERELRAAMARGLDLVAFDVADIYTTYGLVGVLLVDERTVVQFVMSCRVFGLDVERAALAWLQQRLAGRGAAQMRAELAETAHNQACRNVYAGCGFTETEGVWVIDIGAMVEPAHIRMIDEPAPLAA